MADKIIFNFSDDLDYQLRAISSTVNLFKGLPTTDASSIYHYSRAKKILEGDPVRNRNLVLGTKLLENMRYVQLDNDLFADESVTAGNNFTIEMETGTGKTYVYLRTILELYKQYDLKKFMIVVPTVAIRKGVEKSIEQLTEHFKALYGVDLSKYSFIYNTNNPKEVSSKLVESNDLSICVMNIQAFNKSKNKIRQEDEYGQIIWDDIKYIRPIVIIDEPQKIEGGKKKSKSLEAIEDIEPLFVLRYSATHKKLYNQIYKLDSYAAYQQNLVKKITVKTVHSEIPKSYPYIRYKSFTKDLRARIEIFSQDQGGKIRFKSFDVLAGASLEELSGRLSQYKNIFVASQPHKLQPLYISAPDEDIYLEQGQSNYEFEPNETVRIQIKLAIRSHFDKQFELLRKGKKIKALSLFFIDSVAKVRDNDAPDGRGEYLRIFDEEYQKAIKAYKAQFEKYKEYFPDYENVQQVREGYFAVDKKNNAVDVAGWDSNVNDEDVKLNAKSQEDIDRGVELILEKKDELISFNEPLAFIFSHSALREGWDNPNVFTLCTLKASGSDIAKKQEIGRGLRLPVDITGNRCIDSNLNELTVIANDYYDHFAEVLQKDFNDSMNFNKNEITADILISTLKNAGVPKALVTAELVDSLKTELIQNGICNKDNVIKNTPEQTTKLLDKLTFSDERLAEHTELIKKEFVKMMTKKGSRKVEITNGDNEPYENKIRTFVTEDEFRNVYANLCAILQKKTIYVTNIDNEEFIHSCCKEVNELLEYQHVTNTYVIEESHGKFDDAAQFKLSHDANKDRTEVKIGDAEKKSDFEIVNYIMSQTMLPRLAIFKILKGIFKRELLNDQDILEKATDKIKEVFKSISAQKITHYEVVDGYETDSGNIFELDTITEQDFEKEWRVFHSNPNRKAAINEYYKMDSEGEKEFADKLESNENILMFTKLKKGGFVIDTPYGNYSPDWAIICRKDGVEKPELGIYFIVETKINKDHDALTQVEVNKIKCGQLHFKAVSDLVKFNWVKSYEDFKAKFGVKENEV